MAPAVLLSIGLAVLLLWPLLMVLVRGLVGPPPPAVVLVATVVVAVASTVGALGLASVIAAAVRARAAGGQALVSLLRAGLLLPPFVVPIAVMTLGGPGGALARGESGVPGPAAIVIAQTFTFLPHAFALLMWALASVPTDAEQAAELLGASPWTVVRRVTLGAARPQLVTAVFVVLGLCLTDVATPLLLGSDHIPLLVWAVVQPADLPATPLSAAVALSALTAAVALTGRPWRASRTPIALTGARAGRARPGAAARLVLTALAWLIAVAVLALWTAVPLVSLLGASGGGGWHLTLEHWRVALQSARSVGHSLLLAGGVAFGATALALVIAAAAARGHHSVKRVTLALTQLPAGIPGVVASLGYVTAFGAPGGDLALPVLAVVAWTLPLTLPIALDVLARADRATEQAARSLGAGRLTTLRRVILPGLNPAAAGIFAHGFGIGLTAVGTVIVLAQQGRLRLGVIDMLLLAGLGSAGPACAIATVLAGLAGGAMLVGRTATGRDWIPSLLV